MRVIVKCFGLPILDFYTDRNEDKHPNRDAEITCQDVQPAFGFIPAGIEFDKPQ